MFRNRATSPSARFECFLFCRRRVADLGLVLALVLDLSAAEPYLRLRETALGYHGSESDITHLTEIRIGWFGPTNAADRLTGDLWWAANLAVNEANESNGSPNLFGPDVDFLRLPVRLVARWGVDPWGTGVSQLARMVFDEQPLALLGSIDSASTHLAEQVVAKANLPLVSPIVTDNSVTLAGVSWMFSCAPSDAAIARVLVDGIMSALTVAGTDESPARAKLVLLTGTDHESRMFCREALLEFSRRGRLPDFRFDVAPGPAEFARQMDGLARTIPAAVLIIAGVEDAARWVKAVREKAPAARIFGNHSMSRIHFQELAGSAAEGVCIPLLLETDPHDPRYVQFASQYLAAYRRPPDYAALMTYDSTQLLVEAIRRAGPNRARIREALAQLSPWPGLAGTIEFDGTGQNTRSGIRLGTLNNGAIAVLNHP